MTGGSDHAFRWQRPQGDSRHRHVCGDCGYIHYDNPKIVVGAVCVAEDGRILICRRAIEPRKGFWTLPAGYMEENETSADGARREAREEANAEIAIEALLGVYDIPRISQVQLIYRARLLSPTIAPGIETAEVRLAAWDEIPWDDLAFPSVRWALNYWRQTRDQSVFAPQSTPADSLVYRGDAPPRPTFFFDPASQRRR